VRGTADRESAVDAEREPASLTKKK